MTDDKDIRERLVLHGAEVLTDAQLLSILMDVRPPATCFDTAQNALDKLDGRLSAFTTLDIRKMRTDAGLGVRSAANVAAAVELGRRILAEESAGKSVISSNEDVAEIFRPRMAGLKHEEFWVLYLSSGNTIIEKSIVSKGGVSGTVVDYMIIVKKALELLAPRMILVHNHPSGLAEPSENDVYITGRVVAAAKLFDMEVIDHLIITGEDYFSFRKKGLLK